MDKYYVGKEAAYLKAANKILARQGFCLVEDAIPCQRGVTFNLVLRYEGFREMETADFAVLLSSPRRLCRVVAAEAEKRGLAGVLVAGYCYVTLRAHTDPTWGRPAHVHLLRHLLEQVAPDAWAEAQAYLETTPCSLCGTASGVEAEGGWVLCPYCAGTAAAERAGFTHDRGA